MASDTEERNNKFLLKNKNHVNELRGALLNSDSFVDCTLSAEGQILRTHKLMLSLCSPVLSVILGEQQTEEEPYLILPDVPFVDLKRVVDFMYRGEVSVPQEKIDSFLEAADFLKVKGLLQEKDERGVISFPSDICIYCTDESTSAAAAPVLTTLVNHRIFSCAGTSTNHVMVTDPIPIDDSFEENSGGEGLEQDLIIKEEPPIEIIHIDTDDESSSISDLNDDGDVEMVGITSDKKSFICYCEKLFSTESELKAHMNSTPECLKQEQIHDCACGQSFKWKGQLKAHQTYHCEMVKLLKCACGKCFKGKELLIAHKKENCRGKKEFQCGCGRSYANENNLKRHKRFECGDVERQFTCVCKKAFKRKHHLTTHQSSGCPKAVFKCDCGKSFITEKELDRHKGRGCNADCSKNCECGKKFQSKGALSAHMYYDCELKPRYSCECGRSYTLKSNLTRHQITEECAFHRPENSKQVHRIEPDEESASDSDDSKPLSEMGKSASFHCDCGKSYGNMRDLIHHRAYDCGVEKLFKCECGKEFKRKEHLRQHNMNGCAKSAFKCECGRCFVNIDFLNQHTQQGCKKEPIFICACEKIFIKKELLLRHKTKGCLGRQSFSCECGGVYTTKASLKRHKTFDCGAEPSFQCDICQKMFTRKENLKRHVEKSHNDSEYSSFL